MKNAHTQFCAPQMKLPWPISDTSHQPPVSSERKKRKKEKKNYTICAESMLQRFSRQKQIENERYESVRAVIARQVLCCCYCCRSVAHHISVLAFSSLIFAVSNCPLAASSVIKFVDTFCIRVHEPDHRPNRKEKETKIYYDAVNAHTAPR